ncbi:MAG: hypothetical protein HQL38_09980 [Alphaproteobacteria bacterium]|nr:hypothetical protein [Alphaproteobacteria bacterium]
MTVSNHPNGVFTSMRLMSRLFLALAGLLLLGAGVFVATFDPPPPSAKVEKVIADERFPR